MVKKKPKSKEIISKESPELIRIWEEHPNYIREFLSKRSQYEQLCREIAYILEKRFTEVKIEFSAITFRAKSLKSFAEKIIRKNYKDPLFEVTDIAGVRVVYLYATDFTQIEKIIKSEFKIVEKVDTVEDQGENQFGYGAVHFLVKLGKKSAGARYDDLKDLTCEIQARTVSQDAWATIAHHLAYKHKADIPKRLQRKLNSLAGLFETADDQFDRIRSERQSYIKTIQSKLNRRTEFLNQEINLDTFVEFLKWRFPDKAIANPATYEAHLRIVLGLLNEAGYSKLSELDKALNRAEDALAALDSEYPIEYAAGVVIIGLAFHNAEFAKKVTFHCPTLEKIEKYKHLVANNQH